MVWSVFVNGGLFFENFAASLRLWRYPWKRASAGWPHRPPRDHEEFRYHPARFHL